MRYPPSILEEIRARLPTSAVVGRRVKLIKAGREFKGLSPFNAEKSPSFFVNDQKGFYHDFSSGKHGDIFSFLMETEGIAFPEAVERLAAEAGVTLPKISAEAEAQETRNRTLHEVMDLAQAFFQSALLGKDGQRARAYLEGRSLGRSVWERFGIGFAPAGRFTLRDHLAGKGVSADAMIETGLLISGDDIAVPYDRFRDRVMFPITDARGRMIAFGGRALDKDTPAKYLNSPATPLFHKGRVLFNHHLARKAAHDKGTVIAVEGYIDVVSMSLAGFANTVAPLGTALTEDQLTLLWRMTDEPILCFDGDKAGRRAAYRAIDVALPQLEAGKSLRFAMLPEGQDPDDLARSGGTAAVEAILGSALPLVDMVWSRAIDSGPLDTPERRAAIDRKLRAEISQLRDETVRRYYQAEIDKRLKALFAPAARGEYSRNTYAPTGDTAGRPWQRGRMTPPKAGAAIREQLRPSSSLAKSSLFNRSGGISPREALILVTLIAHPDRLMTHTDEIAGLDFSHADTQAIARILLDELAESAGRDTHPTPDTLRAAIERAGKAEQYRRIEAVMLLGDKNKALLGDRDAIDDLLKQALTLHRRTSTLHKELKLAERAFSDDPNEVNLAWLSDLRAQISAFEGTEADTEMIRENEIPWPVVKR